MWLPRLATDRIEQMAPSPRKARALALVAAQEGALRLAAVNQAASANGLRPGMALTQARAMLPALTTLPYDPDADTRLIEAIADWCDRYTPLVGRAPPDTLFLDIAGAAHLLGGERSLLDDLTARLTRQGFTSHAAIAPTPGAAHALARCRPGTIAWDDDLRAHLAPLPVASLRLPDTTVALLKRVGLRTIADLMDRPRAPLAARLGSEVLRRLDQAFGLEHEPVSPRQPIPAASVVRHLAEPLLTSDAIIAHVRTLAEELCPILADRGQGASAVTLSVFRVDGIARRIAVGFARACCDPKMLCDLLALRLDALADPLDPGFGFDTLRLDATAVAAPAAETITFDATADAAADIARLTDHLAARFGQKRICAIRLSDTHIPERAAELVPAHRADMTEGGDAPPLASARHRPIRLLAKPEPIIVTAEVPDGPPLRLRWRRVLLRVTAVEGPERIAPEWWRNDMRPAPHTLPRTRDYYRIEDDRGRRLWVFREGFYDSTGPPPRWFMHGVFA